MNMKQEIKLYSLPTCGRCKILKQKMNEKEMSFIEIDNEQELESENIYTVPVLEVDGQRMNFTDANQWINQQ